MVSYFRLIVVFAEVNTGVKSVVPGLSWFWSLVSMVLGRVYPGFGPWLAWCWDGFNNEGLGSKDFWLLKSQMKPD